MLLLIHGGLWDSMDADRFWYKPGIVADLQRQGFEVLAPNRQPQPTDWATDAATLAALLPDQPVSVVAGSNGCSVAVRFALAHPERIKRLLLAWPATAGDPKVDAKTRLGLASLGAPPQVIATLLSGETLRGITDDEIASITRPVGVLPSIPENPYHQRRTVEALHRLLPQAVALPGCPEPPRPDFPPYVGSFVHTVTEFVAS